METSDRKVGLIFLIFAGLCLLALPFVIFTAMADDPKIFEVGIIQNPDMGFDQGSGVIFENYDRIAKAYLEGTTTTRTLAEFYSRRQYPGSPPFVPHKIEEEDGAQINCLACHERGGWTEALKRNTPVTPHPENGYCRQCHGNKTTLIPDAAKMAHGDIALAHGGAEGPASCFTCHKKDERDYLETEEGMKADMDHSYQLCGQCHFRQKWIGRAGRTGKG